MTRADHAFTSALTVDEHQAIRAVGFSPVGQVMGSCVYHIAYSNSWNCGIRDNSQDLGSFLSVLQPGVPVVARVRDVADLWRARYEAFRRAVDRMRHECVELDGDGAVAVNLTVAPFPAGGLEFRAIGTAVRAAGDVRPPHPFLSDLTGQDFAKLISAGWVPCGLVMGLAAMVRHDDPRTRYQAASWRNVEMSGYTELIRTTRAAARTRLRDDCARRGGTGVVLRTMALKVREQRCRTSQREHHDHLAEATVIGTAITPFRHAGGDTPREPLPVMRLR